MSGLKYLHWHIQATGIWVGCAAVEVLFEKFFQHNENKETKTLLAKLHYYVDLFVELPASLIVALTGTKMLLEYGSHPEKVLAAKVVFGSSAFLMNLGCFYYVYQRLQAALSNDWEEYDRQDKLQHRIGKGVVHSLIVALGLGMYLTHQS